MPIASEDSNGFKLNCGSSLSWVLRWLQALSKKLISGFGQDLELDEPEFLIYRNCEIMFAVLNHYKFMGIYYIAVDN